MVHGLSLTILWSFSHRRDNSPSFIGSSSIDRGCRSPVDAARRRRSSASRPVLRIELMLRSFLRQHRRGHVRHRDEPVFVQIFLGEGGIAMITLGDNGILPALTSSACWRERLPEINPWNWRGPARC